MLQTLKNKLDWQRRLIAILGFMLLMSLGTGSSLWAEDLSQATKAGAKDCQVKKGLIILVEFPDVKHSIDKRYGQKRFFQELNRYVQEMSYQKVCLGGEVTTKWYEMPKSINEYRISPRNLEVDKSRVTQLIQDAIDAVDKDVDLSRYDFNVLFLGARRDQYGMIGLCGYPGMLGWSSDFSMKTKSGQLLKGGAAIYCYQAHLGTLFHDVAHILGGLKEGRRMVPCLYDHDLQAKPGPLRETFVQSIINMGFWDPMSCHYYRWELPPPGISSWTKMRLGWLDPQKIKLVKPGETAEFLLGPLEDGASQILAVKIPLSEKRYYLIENRQPISFDRHLPGNGVLIMIADDTVAECRQGRSPVKLINADPSIPQLEGAAFDIGKKDFYMDQSNNLKIQLLEKAGSAYKIRISPN